SRSRTSSPARARDSSSDRVLPAAPRTAVDSAPPRGSPSFHAPNVALFAFARWFRPVARLRTPSLGPSEGPVAVLDLRGDRAMVAAKHGNDEAVSLDTATARRPHALTGGSTDGRRRHGRAPHAPPRRAPADSRRCRHLALRPR